MSLARDIVRVFTTSWTAQRADAFAPNAEHRLGELPQAAPILERLARQAEPWKPIKILRLVLQALEIHREALSPRLIDSMFVATVPELLTFGARPTELVIREMLQGATRKVFAMGIPDDAWAHAGPIA
jgi:hypothetical protein